MGFRVQIWSGGALWNPLSFLIKDSIQSNLWTGKESSLLKIQLVKNILLPFSETVGLSSQSIYFIVHCFLLAVKEK